MAVTKQKGIVLLADEINRLRDGKPGMIWRTAKIQPPDARQWRISTLVDSTARDDRKHVGKLQWVIVDGLNVTERDNRYFKSPFGHTGDTFYVKEAWAFCRKSGGHFLHYADDPGFNTCKVNKWVSAARIPIDATRFTLTINTTTFKRLQDVTEDEAIVSGAKERPAHGKIVGNLGRAGHWQYRQGFREAWDTTHKKGNRWADNCWQWGAVVTLTENR